MSEKEGLKKKIPAKKAFSIESPRKQNKKKEVIPKSIKSTMKPILKNINSSSTSSDEEEKEIPLASEKEAAPGIEDIEEEICKIKSDASHTLNEEVRSRLSVLENIHKV